MYSQISSTCQVREITCYNEAHALLLKQATDDIITLGTCVTLTLILQLKQGKSPSSHCLSPEPQMVLVPVYFLLQAILYNVGNLNMAT